MTNRNGWSQQLYNNGASSDGHACNCVGPQDGNPLCPCQMRSLTIKDGRYVRIEDFGPVNDLQAKKEQAR